MLPQHGWIGCRKCFRKAGHEQLLGVGDPPPWRLEDNSAAWGSQDPNVVVLGFSKGVNQCRSLPFDEIPFAQAWRPLSQILQAVGVLAPNDRIERHFNRDEPDFHFGSLIRCSVARWDSRDQSYSKSGGQILKKFLGDPISAPAAQACAQRFLGQLPGRTRLVMMLGNDDDYILLCRQLMSNVYPSIRPINPVAYGTDAVTWVHLVHPMAQGRHVPDWLAGGQTKLGQKLRPAQEAVRSAGVVG